MLTFITFSMMSNKFHPNQSIQSISCPVISGEILHVLTLESKKWDAVTRKPTGETVVSYTYTYRSIEEWWRGGIFRAVGLVLDFLGNTEGDFRYPVVSAVFYSGDLKFEDWGEISGTTGRNTKVTGMKSSAKQKMGSGWVSYLDNSDLILKYKRILGQD